MNKYVKVMYAVLGLTFLFFMSPALASTTCDGFDMFGMKCCIEQGAATPQDLQMHDNILYYAQSGVIYQKTSSGDAALDTNTQNLRYFQMLFERRSYISLNFVEDVYLGTTKYTVALGQKCNHPEIRINGKEYRNNLNIFDVKSDGQFLRLYYQEFGMLNAMRCAPQSAYQSPASVSNTTEASTDTQDIISNIETSFPIEPTTQTQNAGTVIYGSDQIIKISPIILKNIKIYQQLNQSTLYDLVKERGMDWKTNRKALAEQAGIEPEIYKGTKAQNYNIREYLLHKISLDIKATNTPDITLPVERFQKVQTIALRRIVGLRSYTWKNDRVNIAKEYGYEPQIYLGTRTQNLKIRTRLLNKIHQQQ